MLSQNEAISIVRAEEGRRGAMLDTTPTDSSTLITLKGSSQEKPSREEERSSIHVKWLTGTPYGAHFARSPGIP